MNSVGYPIRCSILPLVDFLPEWVVPLLLVPLTFLVPRLRDRQAGRRRARSRAGEAVRCRAWLAAGGGRMRRGTLAMEGSTLTWHPWLGGSELALTGARLQSLSLEADGWWTQPGDAVVRLEVTPLGPVRVVLQQGDAELLAATLRRGEGTADATLQPSLRTVGTEPRPGPGPRLWPLALLALLGVWVALCLYAGLAGRMVQAEVIGGDGEGLCQVVWTDPDGTRLDAEVDCDDEPVGARREVWALPAPVRSEAIAPAFGIEFAAVVGGLLGVGAVVGLVLDARSGIRSSRTRRRGSWARTTGCRVLSSSRWRAFWWPWAGTATW